MRRDECCGERAQQGDPCRRASRDGQPAAHCRESDGLWTGEERYCRDIGTPVASEQMRENSLRVTVLLLGLASHCAK